MIFETKPCIVCDEASVLVLDAVKFERWRGGEHVQVVFADWSAERRELLITGTHPVCWETMMMESDCEYCGSSSCDYDCDESQAEGFAP